MNSIYMFPAICVVQTNIFIGLPPNDNLTSNSLHKRLTISDKPKRDHYHNDAIKIRNVRMSVSADGYDQRWKLWDSKIFFSGGLECNY